MALSIFSLSELFWGGQSKVIQDGLKMPYSYYITEGDLDLLILTHLVSSGITGMPHHTGIWNAGKQSQDLLHARQALSFWATTPAPVWIIWKTWCYLSKISILKLSFIWYKIISLLFTIAQSFPLESTLPWPALACKSVDT